MQRIVITGLGAISPLGVGTELNWQCLQAGLSGSRQLAGDVMDDIACKTSAPVSGRADDPEGGFDPDLTITPKDQRKVERFILFALAAAVEAGRHAGWMPETEAQRQRCATLVATGIGGFHTIEEAVTTVAERGSRRMSPFTEPSFPADLAAGKVSMRHGFKGPRGVPVTACAAGVQAIGDAARMIRAGEIHGAPCGGAEACISRTALGGFAAARALSSDWNDTPQQAFRPFDAGRDGFIMGEGAGLPIIEASDHALARGAQPIAEMLGYGTTADAWHVTAGPEGGDGARRATEIAIRQAGLSPAKIGHLNAHATSPSVGDPGELAVVKTLFAGLPGPAIHATKSTTGHILAAAGGPEAIFTALALRDQIAPPTRNLRAPDPAADGLDLVGVEARPVQTDHAITNGFGLGGVNASLVLRHWTGV